MTPDTQQDIDQPPNTLRDAFYAMCFGGMSVLGARGAGRALRAFFDMKFRVPDPWGYATSGYERWKFEQVIRALPERPLGRVLEIGSAEGEFSRMLAVTREFDEMVGVDLSPHAVQRANASASPRSRFVLADATRCPPSGPFDIVICAEVLYYLGVRRPRLAAAVARVLGPDGIVVLQHPVPRAREQHARFARAASLRIVESRVVEHPIRPVEIAVLARG